MLTKSLVVTMLGSCLLDIKLQLSLCFYNNKPICSVLEYMQSAIQSDR